MGGIDAERQGVLALFQVEGQGVVTGHGLHALEGGGVGEGHLLRALMGDHAVHIHVHIGGEIRAGALTIVRAQVVPAGFLHGEAPGDHVAGLVEGRAVQEVHLAVVVVIGGQLSVELTRAADGGLIAGRDLFRLDDDDRVALGVAHLLLRHHGRSLQGHGRQIHAAVLHGEADDVRTGGQLEEHGLGGAVGGIADAGKLHAFRLPGRRGDLVAVAVHGEHAVVHPGGIHLHALHFRTQNLTVDGDGHLGGQRGGGGVDIGQPDLILRILGHGDGHFRLRAQGQGQSCLRRHVLTGIHRQRVGLRQRRIERFDGLRAILLRDGEGAQAHQQHEQSQELRAHAIHPNRITCSCCRSGSPRGLRRYCPGRRCSSPRCAGTRPGRCASRRYR